MVRRGGSKISILCVVSGKGGVGKTVISANLGLALGKDGKQVLLIDADLSSGNLAQYMGIKNLRPDLSEFLAGDEDSIENVLKNVTDKVDILPTENSLRKFLKADITGIESFLPDLSEIYDYVLIDSPPGVSRNSISPIEVSDELLLIVTPDEASVSSAENVQKVGNILEKKMRGFILNKWEEKGFFSRLFGGDTQMSIEKIQARMAMEDLGKVPYDDDVRESTELGEPLLNRFERSRASEAIRKISEKI